ncbi:hypothetical protein HaLaN_29688, partial [Haematococcus lacustris]
WGHWGVGVSRLAAFGARKLLTRPVQSPWRTTYLDADTRITHAAGGIVFLVISSTQLEVHYREATAEAKQSERCRRAE